LVFSEPDQRPTASALLLHPFAMIDLSSFEFKAWVDEASDRVAMEGTYTTGLMSEFEMRVTVPDSSDGADENDDEDSETGAESHSVETTSTTGSIPEE
jgi:hypothetical protein